MYTGTCDIIEMTEEVIDGVTKQNEVVVYTGLRCRISYYRSSLALLTKGDYYLKKQLVTLFLQDEVKVKEGSKIIVTQNGETGVYKNSGKSKVYLTHQEIILELIENMV